jgi:hypothetical protein
MYFSNKYTYKITFSSLGILDLYANNLTGAIPTQLGDLKNLSTLMSYFFVSILLKFIQATNQLLSLLITEEFHINDNELVGRMPREICKMKLEHLVSDCLGARPEVPCECCTVCCQGLPDPKCKDMKATSVKAVKKKK